MTEVHFCTADTPHMIQSSWFCLPPTLQAQPALKPLWERSQTSASHSLSSGVDVLNKKEEKGQRQQSSSESTARPWKGTSIYMYMVHRQQQMLFQALWKIVDVQWEINSCTKQKWCQASVRDIKSRMRNKKNMVVSLVSFFPLNKGCSYFTQHLIHFRQCYLTPVTETTEKLRDFWANSINRDLLLHFYTNSCSLNPAAMEKEHKLYWAMQPLPGEPPKGSFTLPCCCFAEGQIPVSREVSEALEAPVQY